MRNAPGWDDRILAIVTARQAGSMNLIQFKKQLCLLSNEELGELVLRLNARARARILELRQLDQ